jgi:rsbT co-antagonist protein RsbR
VHEGRNEHARWDIHKDDMANHAPALGSFFNTSPTPMAMLDRSGSFIAMNDAWKGIAGSAANEPPNGRFTDFLAPDDAASAHGILDALAPGEQRVFEARLSAKAVASKAETMRFHVSRAGAADEIQLVAIPSPPAQDVATGGQLQAEMRAITQREHIALQAFFGVLESASVIFWAADQTGTVLISEGKGLERLGLRPNQLVGANLLDVYKDLPDIRASVEIALAGDGTKTVANPAPGVYFDGWNMPLRDAPDGEVTGAFGFAIDTSERNRALNELHDKLALIEQQGDTIRELATPIIQVWDEVVVLPVIGKLESARTTEMMESLLTTIVRERARFAILDLTGVDLVDTSTADYLVQLARATKVVGAHCVLCGLRPAVAQAIGALGLDLGSVRTMQSMRDALKWCIRQRGE